MLPGPANGNNLPLAENEQSDGLFEQRPLRKIHSLSLGISLFCDCVLIWTKNKAPQTQNDPQLLGVVRKNCFNS